MRVLLLIALLPLVTLAAAPPFQPQPPPAPTASPPPEPSPEPERPPSVAQQIIHRLLFPAETIGQALTNVFNQAAEREAESLSQQAATWGEAIGEVIQAPSQGWFEEQARASLPTAAALAPALFILRLAIYHWRRLIGEDDSALRAFGDWVTAGALAVAAGPFLDLAARLGWWMAGTALGETADLAYNFVSAMSLPEAVLAGLRSVSLFSGIIGVGLALAGLLAVAGFLFAFAAANATLYVLAVVAPPVAVLSVIPHMRWLRGLWLKAVGLLALLPVVAGAVFKAGLLAAGPFSGGGLLGAIIRLLWLLGAVGALLSLAGLLGRVTLSTGVGSALKLAQGVAGVAGLVALAAGGAGVVAALGGASGPAGGGSAAGAVDMAPGVAEASGPGTGFPVASLGGPSAGTGSDGAYPGQGNPAALAHLTQAGLHTQQAAFFDALGLRAPARYAHSLAQREQLAARQAELAGRMARFAGAADGPQVESEIDLSPDLYRQVLSGFGGSASELARGFHDLSSLVDDSAPALPILAARYPQETGRVVRAYQEDPRRMQTAENPLLEAAHQAGARGILRDVFGEEPGDGQSA
jgi:hypothetical protein